MTHAYSNVFELIPVKNWNFYKVAQNLANGHGGYFVKNG